MQRDCQIAWQHSRPTMLGDRVISESQSSPSGRHVPPRQRAGMLVDRRRQASFVRDENWIPDAAVHRLPNEGYEVVNVAPIQREGHAARSDLRSTIIQGPVKPAFVSATTRGWIAAADLVRSQPRTGDALVRIAAHLRTVHCSACSAPVQNRSLPSVAHDVERTV